MGRLGLLAWVVALAVCSCSSDKQDGERCVPGELRNCAGYGGCAGTQACNFGGNAFGVCQCVGADPIELGDMGSPLDADGSVSSGDAMAPHDGAVDARVDDIGVDLDAEPADLPADSGVTSCPQLVFDGVDDYISIPDAPDFDLASGNFTIELYAKIAAACDDANGACALIGQDQLGVDKWIWMWSEAGYGPASSVGAFFHTFTAGTPSWWVDDRPPPAIIDHWAHLALVRNGNRLSTYVDGNSVTTELFSVPVPNPVVPLRIGMAEDAFFFAGRIADVRISSSARYNASFVPDTRLVSDADTIALWHLDEGSGTTAIDASGHGHDGTMVGGAVWVDPCAVNRPPTAPAIRIAPARPTSADDLSCEVTTPSTDPDGDSVSYRYAWRRDGSATGYTTSVVTSSATATGEEWTCAVTPTDGDLDGPTVTASVTISDCPVLTFDGVDDYVSIPDSAAFAFGTSPFTVELYARISPGCDDASGACAIIGQDELPIEKWILMWSEAGYGPATSRSVFFHTFTGGAPSWWVDDQANAGLLNRWAHLAVVRGGNTLSLFVDGHLATSEAFNIVVPDPAFPLTIGMAENGLYYAGRIAEVRISSVARYATDFTPARTLTADANTLGLWHLDEGSGTTVIDASGHGHHGTIMGGAAWATESCR